MAVSVQDEDPGPPVDPRPVVAVGSPPAPLRAAAAEPAAIREVGHRLAAAMDGRRTLRASLDDRLMDRIAAVPELRAALFRLVDVRPACRDFDDLADHLAALLAEVEAPVAPFGLARTLARRRGGRRIVGAASAAGVRAMATRFIVGADADAAAPAVRRLWDAGVGTSIDLLGEATVSPAEADAYARRCLDTLDALGRAAPSLPARPVLEADRHGAVPRVNLSVKVSALTPHLRADAPARAVADAAPRLRAILARGREVGAHVHVDMESLDHREAVRDLALQVLAEDEQRRGPSAGLVHQAYLVDAGDELDLLLDWARRTDRETPLTVRLVKGAYWDHEVIAAQQNGWEVPVHVDRRRCDRAFEALTLQLLDETALVRPAIASHNLRSVAHAIAQAQARGVAGDVEYQVLRGLGDDLGLALAAEGLRVRSYCPIGDLVAGMAYLVRRLLENTANDSFLRARAEGADLDRLLEAP